jgi:hypothetical protein
MMARAFGLLRAGYGAVLLGAPGAVIGICTGQPASSRARATARLLGARHLAQAAVTVAAPTGRVLAVGAGLDLAHAASMLALAAGRRPLRRAELADAATEAAFAVLGAAGPAITARPGRTPGAGR